jgi:hypothetical protein
MSDLGLETREVRDQSDRLPAEKKLDCSENTNKPRLFLLLPALALRAYNPLSWNSKIGD